MSIKEIRVLEVEILQFLVIERLQLDTTIYNYYELISQLKVNAFSLITLGLRQYYGLCHVQLLTGYCIGIVPKFMTMTMGSIQ